MSRTASGRLGRRIRTARARVSDVRPSQVVGALAALAAALLVGRLVLGLPGTVRALAAGGLLGGVVYALASDSPPVQAVGAALLFPAGLLGAAATGVVGGALSGGLATAGAVYATVAAVGAVGFAAALAGADAPAGGAIKRAALRAIVVVLAPVVLFAAAVAPDGATAGAVLRGVVDVLADVVGHLLASPPSLSAFVFPVLLAATAWALRGALRRLPVAELVDPSKRDRVAEQLALADRACLYGIAGGLVLLVAGVFLAMRARSPELAEMARVPGGRTYAPIAGSPLLRAPLVLVLVTSLAVVAGYRLLRWARRATVESLAKRFTPVVVGFLATAGLARLFVDAGVVARLVRVADETVGAGELLSGPAPFVVAVGVLLVAGWLATAWLFSLVVVARVALPRRATSPEGESPDGRAGGVRGRPEGDLGTASGRSPRAKRRHASRATGAALAAASCFALALVAVLVGRLLAGFLAAALALLAWDAGAFGGTLRTELSGRSGRTELVHLGGSAVVAAVAVGVAAALTIVLGGAIASATVGAMLALGLAGLSAFLLLSSL